MKRNTVLKLLALAVVTSAAQLTLAGSGLSSVPVVAVQRTDTIRDTTGDSVPPLRMHNSADTQGDNTVNEQDIDRYDRNNDWKNKDAKDDRKTDRKDDQNDLNTNDPTKANDSENPHGMQ